MRFLSGLFLGCVALQGAALADGGNVKGTVTLVGSAPAPAPIHVTDPNCGKTPRDETVVRNANGTLRNVLVYIKDAPPAPPPPVTAKIEQVNCMFRPRVQGIVAGQTLAIRNNDGTLHNVHTYRGTTTLFNQAQVPNTPGIEKKFSYDGALIKFKCDVHAWMGGYVWVQNSPYFAVTDDKGSFTIHDVPPGTYTIVAWHERLGEKQVGQVTVKPGQENEIKFEYAAAATAAR